LRPVFSVYFILPNALSLTKYLFQILSFAIVVLVSAAVASVIQTRVSIAEVKKLGLETSITKNFLVTAEDLVRFSPIMTIISSVNILISIVLLALLRNVTPTHRFLFLPSVTGQDYGPYSSY
jgi:hypothetical protein